MTLGLLGKQSRAWFGLAGEIGHTTLRVPGRDFTYERVTALPAGRLPEDADATLVRWTVTGILGSNYSFLAWSPQSKRWGVDPKVARGRWTAAKRAL